MRLLLVEDNQDLARLLAKGLSSAGFDTDVFGTAGDARTALANVRYSAVILDLGLPDDDGVSILKELRSRGDPTPVLILTARGGVRDRVNGLRDGADDYLVKPFALEELLARVEAILRRPGQILGISLKLGNLQFDTVGRQAFIDNEPCVFSAREAAVLEILLRRQGRVVPKKNVEDQIFGLSGDVSSNAVEVYVSRLRKQLLDKGARVQIHTIRGVGYMASEAK
jgi:DNA-binding response OmpR family regulator